VLFFVLVVEIVHAGIGCIGHRRPTSKPVNSVTNPAGQNRPAKFDGRLDLLPLQVIKVHPVVVPNLVPIIHVERS
jgi:hypothetical protein